MAEVKVLIEGYARKEEKYFSVTPSTVLIKDSGKKILADPGLNKELLLKSLKKEGLKPEDIDIVFLTHWHPDHVMNIRVFPDGNFMDADSIYENDKIIRNKTGKILDTNIEIVQTLGHSNKHASLIAETENGRICVAGDLWWWTEGQEQKTDYESLLNLRDPLAKDMDALLESRKKILGMADWIIPGHGKMFKVDK